MLQQSVCSGGHVNKANAHKKQGIQKGILQAEGSCFKVA